MDVPINISMVVIDTCSPQISVHLRAVFDAAMGNRDFTNKRCVCACKFFVVFLVLATVLNKAPWKKMMFYGTKLNRSDAYSLVIGHSPRAFITARMSLLVSPKYFINHCATPEDCFPHAKHKA